MENIGHILYEYLYNTLYQPEAAKLDLADLPDDFQKLGELLVFLNRCVEEERIFAKDMLQTGMYSARQPSDDNVLVTSLKRIQEIIVHITGLTDQIAKGDYSQRITNLPGQFPKSFNTMIEQLDQRSKQLANEKKLLEIKNKELRQATQLMQILADDTNDIIYAYEIESGAMVFANQSAKTMAERDSFLSTIIQQKLIEHQIDFDDSSNRWELTVNSDKGYEKLFYDVESFCSTQNENEIIFHILTDNTEKKNSENLTITDSLTGLHNKCYAMNIMEKYSKAGIPFIIAFVDIDYLKYCNDTYGHESGDAYLLHVTKMLNTITDDPCRIGGDEFLLVIKDIDEITLVKKLFALRTQLETTGDEPYPKSFSFGISYVPVNHRETIESYINQADKYMYQFKQIYKKPLSDVTYQDNRNL